VCGILGSLSVLVIGNDTISYLITEAVEVPSDKFLPLFSLTLAYKVQNFDTNFLEIQIF
jgi:hypothetical protein